MTSANRIAPSTTPGIEPSPPTTTIVKMKIENENWNCSALTTERYDARNAPATPPSAAPVA